MNWNEIKEMNKDKIETLSQVWNEYQDTFKSMSDEEIDKLRVSHPLCQDINKRYPGLFPGGGGEIKYFIKNYQEEWYLKKLFCPTCGKPISWRTSKQYPGACSFKCSTSNPEVQAKKKATTTANGSQESCKEKRDEWVKKKFGVATAKEGWKLVGEHMNKVMQNDPNHINPMKNPDIVNKNLAARGLTRK